MLVTGFEWRSPGGVLFSQLLVSGVGPAEFDANLPGLFSRTRRMNSIRLKEEVKELIRQSNYRGHVNERLARHLKLPYQPSIVRLPFRGLFNDFPRLISDRLPSVVALDEHYAARAAQVSLLVADPFIVPVFVAIDDLTYGKVRLLRIFPFQFPSVLAHLFRTPHLQTLGFPNMMPLKGRMFSNRPIAFPSSVCLSSERSL